MFGKKKDGEATGLEPGADVPRSPRITASDIQQKQFSSQRKDGYAEAEVDAFLDELTDEFVRLSEEARRGTGMATGAVASAVGTADADKIKREAREQADAILADARARAAAMTAGAPESGGTGLVDLQAFLTQEREFLHGIAGMIQQHAETIRGMARAAKDGAQVPASEAGSSSGDVASVPMASGGAGSGGSDASAPQAASAWTATSSGSVATAEAAPEVRGQVADNGLIKIPASSVDTPSGPSADEVIARQGSFEGPADAAADEANMSDDQRSLRELFWGED